MATSSESEVTTFWDCLEAAVSVHRQGRLKEADELGDQFLRKPFDGWFSDCPTLATECLAIQVFHLSCLAKSLQALATE